MLSLIFKSYTMKNFTITNKVSFLRGEKSNRFVLQTIFTEVLSERNDCTWSELQVMRIPSRLLRQLQQVG